jgi:hypothetical protein
MLAAPMARLQQETQAAVTTGSAETAGIPRAIVLRLIRDLPGDRLDCPRHHALVARRLGVSTGTPGPHDFAVRTGLFVGEMTPLQPDTPIASRAQRP